MMDRRAFLGTVVGGLLAAPLTAEAQEAAKAARIGWRAVNLTANPRLREAFVQGLRDLGYVEGRNVVIEDRSAEGKPERVPALAPPWLRLRWMSSWPQAHPKPWPPSTRRGAYPLSSLVFPIR